MLKRLCTWKCPRSYLSCVVVQQLVQRRDIYYSWGFCALKFILSVHKALDQHDYWTMSLSFWWPTSQGLAPEWGIIQVTLRSDLPSSRTAFKGCPSKLPSSERVASPWIRYQPIVVLTDKNNHILSSMWSLQCTVPQKSLGRGRRSEHPERTFANMGRTCNPPHRKDPGGQGHFCSGWGF